jgi:hypothetical protein
MKPAKQSTIHTPSIPPLRALALRVNDAIEVIRGEEEIFGERTLASRLHIGLACLQAHHQFAVLAPDKRGQLGGRGKKSSSRRDELSPASFEQWLMESTNGLKKPVAYKYIAAVKGLGCDEHSSPSDVDDALETLREATETKPTLASLIAACPDRSPLPPPSTGPRLIQQDFEFYRAMAVDLRTQTTALVSHREDMPEAIRRAATAQLYTALYEMTGTHWAPTDEAPDIASVDPDTITI